MKIELFVTPSNPPQNLSLGPVDPTRSKAKPAPDKPTLNERSTAVDREPWEDLLDKHLLKIVDGICGIGVGA